MRIIPAHAGNTCWNMSACRYAWDHPRACGEHRVPLTVRHSTPGSSPRMRGTLTSCGRDASEIGIIPAHAGNTPFSSGSMVTFRDHPRACGEHLSMRIQFPLQRGSSPRMRGTHAGVWVDDSQVGIIPAHAGNTANHWLTPDMLGDHPRACGEHSCEMSVLSTSAGSSPRMRGTPVWRHADEIGRGIIPAHAGNTCSSTPIPHAPRDHPRACGEHGSPVDATGDQQGSSPRMRGTPVTGFAWGAGNGIIPAHAGNTQSADIAA